MAHIIRAGQCPEAVTAPPPPWIGVRVVCPHCQAVFILNDTDEERMRTTIITSRANDRIVIYEVHCVTCGGLVPVHLWRGRFWAWLLAVLGRSEGGAA